MAYICQNCGVTDENEANVCNPISDMYKNKSCSVKSAGVCDEHFSDMKYTCECGNVSADPQHICRPKR